jgi:hypothetical protein
MLAPIGDLQAATEGGRIDRVARSERLAIPRRALPAPALLWLAAVIVICVVVAARHASTAPATRASHGRPTGTSLVAQGRLVVAPGPDSVVYPIAAGRGGLQTSGPAHGLHARFGSWGALVSSRGARLGLRLRAVGYGNSLLSVPATVPTMRAGRLTYTGRGIEEWYGDGPLGIEQGFTIPEAPASHRTGMLTLSMTLSGNTHATLAEGAQSIIFRHGGASSLRYGGLRVSDARGRRLHGWLALHSGALLIQVDARNASYPLRVDPFIQQGEKLSISGAYHFGDSVALSADGNTALIGGGGGASVFTRSGASWAQQQALGISAVSVALSGDGKTALVEGSGGIFVFTYSGEGWTQQQKLTVGAECGGGRTVTSGNLALSGDGKTALIGTPGYTPYGYCYTSGAARVFTRSGETWTQQGEKLSGSGEAGEGEFGASVALSSNGSTAVIGGPRDNAGVGAVWAFTRSGETWTQQGEKLIGSGEAGGAVTGCDGHYGYSKFGESVALSADGNTVLVGGPSDNADVGAAWVFARSGEAWSQQGEKLAGPELQTTPACFGTSVALSANGSKALIGGPNLDYASGAAWMDTRSGATWIGPGEQLTGGGEHGDGRFGWSVALAGAGDKTALIGGPVTPGGEQNAEWGAAWVFVKNLTVTGVTPTSGPATGGTTVTITGTNFAEVTAVKFGSLNAARFTVKSPTKITAVAPPGADTVDVTVTTTEGSSAANVTDSFHYLPVVSSVSPKQGPVGGGTTVAIAGVELTGATSVMFGSSEATSFTVNSDTSITAISPEGLAGAVHVRVTAPEGASRASSKDEFRFAPTVTGVSPATGSKAGGTTVTVTGSGFLEGTTGTTFKFGTAAGTAVDCTSTTECTVMSPPHATGKTDVRATVDKVASAVSRPADQFTYG